jgi:hypothetical protein
MTTYDPYGRQVQTVDPGLALVGVAAAGLIGYAAGNRDDRYDHGGYDCDGYYGGYARQSRRCR